MKVFLTVMMMTLATTSFATQKAMTYGELIAENAKLKRELKLINRDLTENFNKQLNTVKIFVDLSPSHENYISSLNVQADYLQSISQVIDRLSKLSK